MRFLPLAAALLAAAFPGAACAATPQAAALPAAPPPVPAPAESAAPAVPASAPEAPVPAPPPNGDGTPPPPPAGDPPARPPPAEEGPRDPAPAPKEAPVPPKTSPEARALLEEAAKRQGTAELVGAKAPDRFQASFAKVVVHSAKGDRAEIAGSVEAFALPAPGSREARLRSEWKAEGKRVVLGHNGRFGWMKDGDEAVRRFVDRERDAADIEDLDHRRRMLRLALRVFFLANLADGPAPVLLLPDETRVLPVGHRGDSRKAACCVLERAAAPAEGEPAIRIYLDAKTLDPLAILLLAPEAGEPAFLLTLDYDADEIRRGKDYPPGVRVPDWIELFEIPAAEAAAPAIRVQAGLQGLAIDPARVPDSLFAVPK